VLAGQTRLGRTNMNLRATDFRSADFRQTDLKAMNKIRLFDYMVMPAAHGKVVSKSASRSSDSRSMGICCTTELITTLDRLCAKALEPYSLAMGRTPVGTEVKLTHNRPAPLGSVLCLRGHVAQVTGATVDFVVDVFSVDDEVIASAQLRFALVMPTCFARRLEAPRPRVPDVAKRVSKLVTKLPTAGLPVWAFTPPPAPFSSVASGAALVAVSA
jgi:predicted thioesterase